MRPPPATAFQAIQSACLDPETFTLEDLALWQALDEHTRLGGEVLDLSAHAVALCRAPEALMEAFADVCRAAPRRLKILYLPADLVALPWLGALPWVERLTAPGPQEAPAPEARAA